jgi:hypothetical protein
MDWIVLLLALGVVLYNLDSINIRISFWKRKPVNNLLKPIDVRPIEKQSADKSAQD